LTKPPGHVTVPCKHCLPNAGYYIFLYPISSLLSHLFVFAKPTEVYSTMPKSILLPQFFLPPSAVSLGRFVLSLDHPHQDFHDPTSNTSPDFIEKVQTQYESLHHSAKHQNVASQLTTFLSSSFAKRLKASVRITADEARTYYLTNAGQWFRDAVKSQETREWIERTIDEGEDIYVIVAYHTLVNARILEQLGGQSSAGGDLAIPVSTALTASGVVVPFDMADPGLSGFRGRLEDEQRQFMAPGEQIYAVQYRKVSWRLFSRNKMDKMTLGTKAWWEIYDGPRNPQGEPEDMLEVELEDEIAIEGEHEDMFEVQLEDEIAIEEEHDEAIRVARQAIKATPDDHPDLAERPNNLREKLAQRYERTGAMVDLEEAIQVTRQAIEVTPNDHSDLPIWLKTLGNKLESRYKRTEKMEDLEEAIQVNQAAWNFKNATPDQQHTSSAGMDPDPRSIRKGKEIERTPIIATDASDAVNFSKAEEHVKPRLTKEQHQILENYFQQQHKPSTGVKKAFADQLGVPLDKINASTLIPALYRVS
jgi:tetratricopeptide (TPR) repeat protein